MARRRQRPRRGDSSSFSSSSSDEPAAEETPPTGYSDIRDMIQVLMKTQRKEAKKIESMLEKHKEDLQHGLNEIKVQLKNYIEEHIVLHRELERQHYPRGDVSQRTETTQIQPPRFHLRIISIVNQKVETGKIIQTNHGNSIEVALYDGDNPIANNHPLASARVMMVVLHGDFNKDNNRYNWSKEDFMKSIRKPLQGNSTTRDVDQIIESIVSNCTFHLSGGSHHHSGATIVNNSGNKNVRLGVMVLSHSEERVLEGLSNHFLVRDPPKNSRKQKRVPVDCCQVQNGTIDNYSEQALIGCGQERNGPMPNSGFAQNVGNGINPVQEQPPISAYNASNIAGQYPPLQQSWLLPGGHHQSAEDTHPALMSDYFMGQTSYVPNWEDQIARPVQLVWDWPDVEPRKRWNLLDQLMPLYNRQTKIHSDSFSIDLVGARDITTIPNIMQAHRNRGVLIQPLEHDEDDEPPVKRNVHKKYRLRFVNKVCNTYYTWEQIEADNGNLLKVALYDENNAIVKSGPLSSVSVEVVVLHGDFNSIGQDDWTSEQFRDYLMHPRSVKDTSVLGGHLVLILVDGQSSIGCAFFRKTSSYARTEKFRMGVMLTGTPDGRVQEGISEPFWVRNRQGKGTMSKQSSPQLADDVCPLENTVTQNEDYNKCLVSHNICMVRNMRKNLDMDEEKVRGIISNHEPEEMDDHARTCDQLVGVKFDRQYKKGVMDFTTNEVELEGKLELQAHKNKDIVQFDHMTTAERALGINGTSWSIGALAEIATELDPQGPPYHKIPEPEIIDLQNGSYQPSAHIEINDKEADTAGEVHNGDTGIGKLMEVVPRPQLGMRWLDKTTNVLVMLLPLLFVIASLLLITNTDRRLFVDMVAMLLMLGAFMLVPLVARLVRWQGLLCSLMLAAMAFSLGFCVVLRSGGLEGWLEWPWIGKPYLRPNGTWVGLVEGRNPPPTHSKA